MRKETALSTRLRGPPKWPGRSQWANAPRSLTETEDRIVEHAKAMERDTLTLNPSGAGVPDCLALL
jgi:hypothetical protein